MSTPYSSIQQLPQLLAKSRPLDSSQDRCRYDIATPEEALSVASRLENSLADLGDILTAVGMLTASAAGEPPADPDLHYGLGSLMMMVGPIITVLADGIPDVRLYATTLEAEQKKPSGPRAAC